MKHIKTFEKYDPDKLRLFLDELEEFCQESLVFLTDLGPRLSIDSSYGRYVLPRKIDDEIEAKISLTFMDLDRRWVFNWIDIKDYIIPFMMRLNKNYSIKEVKITGRYRQFDPERNAYFGVPFVTNLKDVTRIVNDEIDNHILIQTIQIEIDTDLGDKPFAKIAGFGGKINQVVTKAANKLSKFLNDKI